MALEELLKKNWFSAHPFNTWIAEDEKELDNWFVRPPFIKTIMGDSGGLKLLLRPASNLIFGVPGSGKTALRIMVERQLLKRTRHALVLRYVNFTIPLLSSSRPSLSDHVEELLKLGTIGLLGFWQEFPDSYLQLKVSEKAELAGLAFRYYDNMPPEAKHLYTYKLSPVVSRISGVIKTGTKTVVDAYNATVSVLKLQKIEPNSWASDNPKAPDQGDPYLRLQRFWSLAKAMGVESIWILVDGVDEAPNVREGEAICNCIVEFLLAQSIMEFRQNDEQVICFKVFLTKPEQVQPLLDEAGFRRDRVKSEVISWTRRELDEALSRRLAYFSYDKVLTFDNICDASAAGTHDRLLDESKLRPRTLFRMGHEIFAAFQRKNEKATYKIDKQSVEDGISAALKAVVD